MLLPFLDHYQSHELLPQLQVENYRPELIWSDGDWEGTDEYWTSKEFIAWLYNDSPVKHTVVVNDRWGEGDVGKHGDYYTFSDRYNPGIQYSHSMHYFV